MSRRHERKEKKWGGAVRERDISGCDSSARERHAERDGVKQTRVELTVGNRFQCEAESMLGAVVTRRQCFVNTNKTRGCQRTQHSNLSVKANTSANYKV